MSGNNERDFKGVWIPKEIWLDINLTWSEKLLLVELDSLSTLEKGCFATNEYLGSFFNLSKDRISKLITSLKKKGYIETKLIYKKGSKEVDKRVITTIGYRLKCLEGIGENNHTCIGENDYTPLGENNEDINTVIINTKNISTINKTGILFEIQSLEIGEELKTKLIEFFNFRKELKKPIKTMSSINKLISSIGKTFIDESDLMECIDNSIMNGYQGVFPNKNKKTEVKKKSFAQRELERLEAEEKNKKKWRDL